MAKHIDFIDGGTSESGKTRLWHVVPKEHPSPIGVIHWYGPWREYVMKCCPYPLDLTRWRGQWWLCYWRDGYRFLLRPATAGEVEEVR